MDYTVVDLTGFSDQSVSDITNFIDSLPESEQAKIIRIGF
jgi:cytochrome c1